MCQTLGVSVLHIFFKILIIQCMKLFLDEIKMLAQCQATGKWQSQNLSLDLSVCFHSFYFSIFVLSSNFALVCPRRKV